MEAQTTVSNWTQCGLFTGEYKKYTVSGVTFSFKENRRERLTFWVANEREQLGHLQRELVAEYGNTPSRE